MNYGLFRYCRRSKFKRLPVRSAISKHNIARIVLQWVAIRECLIL